MKEHIRRDHLIDGKSIRQIARERHLSRNTIRAAIKDAGPTVYKRKKEPPAPVLGSFHAIVKQILKDDENQPKKQRHTCRRIWERLRDEHGFTGAESTVRGHSGRIRPSLRETYIPLEFDPGTDAQFDWGDVDVVLQGQHMLASKTPISKSLETGVNTRANDETRTRDLLITNQLLYRLSYIGVTQIV